MDQKILELVNRLTIVNPECVIMLQEEIGDTITMHGGKEILTPDASSDTPGGNKVKLFYAPEAKTKSQTAVGRGTVLKKSSHSCNPLLEMINPGDKIVFNPGSQRSAGYNQFKLLQIIHSGDILFKEEVDAKKTKANKSRKENQKPETD